MSLPVPRRGRGRRARLLLLGAPAALLVSPWPPATTDRPCAAPTIAIEGAPPGVVALHRGQQVTVTGRGFVEGCGNPGSGPVPGCNRTEPAAEPTPMAGVELELLGGRVTRRATALGRADAGTAADGRLGRVTWTVEIPDGQATGPAALQVEGPQGATIGLGVVIRPAE